MNTFFDLFLNDFFRGDEYLQKLFESAENRAAGRFPPLNVYSGENQVLLEVLLPGKEAKDVAISLEEKSVTLAENRVAEEGDKEAAKGWKRRVELPFAVDPDQAKAVFRDGILRVTLPKLAEAPVRQIAIACA